MELPVIRIIIADGQQIFIEGLKTILSRGEQFCFEVVGEALTGNSLLKLMKNIPADILFLDMGLADMDGLEVLSSMKELDCQQVKIVTLSIFDEPKVVKAAFKAGTDAYVLKSSNAREIFEAVGAVLRGETYMSLGLSLTNDTGRNSLSMQEGKLLISYDDRFVRKYNLSKRELEVLKLVAQAMTNKDIAKELYISDQTVSVHRKNIMRKLGVGNTASLIKMAYEHHLL